MRPLEGFFESTSIARHGWLVKMNETEAVFSKLTCGFIVLNILLGIAVGILFLC